MKDTDALATLQRANDDLRSAILQLSPERSSCLTITPKDFSDLLSQISTAKECLRRLGGHSAAAAIEQGTLAFRGNLETLKDLLPDLHGRLLAEKSRLEIARNEVASTAAWARANQQIF
jgi:hypothetical protein